MRIADLFCGIGSFHHSSKELGMTCVFACDIDAHVRKVYKENWGLEPEGDITTLTLPIPEHDILCGGFPCQPFSQIGQHRGTDDTRGRLVDYIIAILNQNKPKACVLENVPALLTSENGDTYAEINHMLQEAGYKVDSKILKASDFGIPQMRKRLFIVAIRSDISKSFQFPNEIVETPTLAAYMGMPFEKTVAYTIRCGGGHGQVGERHNWDTYQLTDGNVYRLNPDDCLKLQGFDPSLWSWGGVALGKRVKMVGNTIPTCLSKAVLQEVQRTLQA
jgi:DNA (cytosine-5)-methyltransferase 1